MSTTPKASQFVAAALLVLLFLGAFGGWFCLNSRSDDSKDLARKELTNSIGMKLVLIPPGKFMMGSPKEEKGRFEDEEQHEVKITKPFYMGIHEVTIGQFRAFVKAESYQIEAEKDNQGGWGYNAEKNEFEGGKPKYTWKDTGWEQSEDHPVVNVTWNDAKAFCDWLSRQEKKEYRLPTEAEWEYACRAGTKTRYYSGDDEETLATVGNVSDASAKRKFPKWTTIEKDDGYVFAAPVGRFQANAFGLFDMHGNVWEWCQDWYGYDYYGKSPREDPKGPQNGESRVKRGGSWYYDPRVCRSAKRASGVSIARNNLDSGFRVVLVAHGTP